MNTPLNIMLLQCEDIGRHLGCYGEPDASTPHMDHLAADGCRYTNAFSHAPVCAPSRGGMVTGRYPYSLGNHHMRSKLAENPRIFTHILREAGYHVNWHTKMDFNFEPADGWRDASESWVDQAPPEEPFFVYQNFSSTHESTMFPDGEERHGGISTETKDALEHRAELLEAPPYLTDGPELRYELKRYADSISRIDAQIGRRLKWLDDHGLRENTLVIVLSDHGRGLPREKRWCYDAGVHLPLIIRWPGQIEPGTVSEDLVGWVDIAPTILNAAGLSVPGDYQGEPFVGPHADSTRECAFGGRDRMDEVFDRVRYARNEKWHYIKNDFPELPWATCQNYMEQQPIMPLMRQKWKEGTLEGDEAVFFADSKPSEELYDTDADPFCMNNLAGDPACADVLETMRGALSTHRKEVNDLGDVTEEELIERGVVQDVLQKYRVERPPVLKPEDHPGPHPFPSTLREAEAHRASLSG